jgi:hypothetical protein
MILYEAPTELLTRPAISPTTDQASPPPCAEYFQTMQDLFRLSRKYYGTEHPSCDHEDYVTPEDLCDSDHFGGCNLSKQSFYPYPN